MRPIILIDGLSGCAAAVAQGLAHRLGWPLLTSRMQGAAVAHQLPGGSAIFVGSGILSSRFADARWKFHVVVDSERRIPGVEATTPVAGEGDPGMPSVRGDDVIVIDMTGLAIERVMDMIVSVVAAEQE